MVAADGTVLWMTGPATVRDYVVPSITAAAQNAGRPAPRVVCVLPVCVTDDVAASRAAADKIFAIYGQLPSYRAMMDREGADGPADLAIIGNENTVSARLEELSAAGVTEFVAGEFMPREGRSMRKAPCVEIYLTPPERTLHASASVESFQPYGSYRTSDLNHFQAHDPDTLLAMQVNGEPLAADHGYPLRLIAPDRPGVMQTKWIKTLVVN